MTRVLMVLNRAIDAQAGLVAALVAGKPPSLLELEASIASAIERPREICGPC